MTLRQAVQVARGITGAGARISRIYDELAVRIAERGPICEASGRCCRFEEYGHRLYVTTLELAVFMEGYTGDGEVTLREWGGRGCMFQVGKLCSVHGIRPFGCRVFFCDPTAQGWQNETYEQFHAEIKKLHDELGVDYFYVDWRAAMKELLEGGPVNPAHSL